MNLSLSRTNLIVISVLFFVLGIIVSWYSLSLWLMISLSAFSFLFLILWVLYQRKNFKVLLLSIVAFVIGLSNVKLHEFIDNNHNLPTGRSICLTGTVTEAPKEASYGTHKLVISTSQWGKLQVKLKNSSSLPNLGDEIQVHGILQKPLTGERFNEALYFKSQSIKAKLVKAEVIQINKATSLSGKALSLVADLQAKIISIHKTQLMGDESSLVQAMLIGRTAGTPLSKQLRLQGQTLGVAHIYAASALNLTGLILFVSFWLNLFKLPFKPRIWTLVFINIFYTFLSGWVPSMLRACFIANVVLFGKLIKRQISLLNTLLVAAALALLINPNQIGDLGFQFSYLATLGIVLWQSKLVKTIKFVPRSWAEPLAITLTAEALLLPLQLYYFHNLPVYSLLANLLAVPIASLILLLGLLSSLLCLFGPIGWLIASIVELAVSLSVKSLIVWLNFLSSLPASNLTFRSVPIVWVIWLTLLILGIGFFFRFKLMKHFLAAGFVCLLFWSFCCQPNNLVIQSVSKRWYEITILTTPENKQIVICNQSSSKSNIASMEKDLQALSLHTIDYWIGNCKAPNKIVILRNLNPKGKTNLQISKLLKLKISPKATLIDYNNFAGLILFEPMSLNNANNFYSLVKHSYVQGTHKKIIWSDSPKAEYCLTSHLDKKQRSESASLLKPLCHDIYNYLEMKNKIIITDGETLEFKERDF